MMNNVETVTKDYAHTIENIQITDEEKLFKYHVDMTELYEKKIEELDMSMTMREFKIKYYEQYKMMFSKKLEQLEDDQMRASKIKRSAVLYQKLICVSTEYIKREYKKYRCWMTEEDKFELRTYFINRYNFRFRYTKPFIY